MKNGGKKSYGNKAENRDVREKRHGKMADKTMREKEILGNSGRKGGRTRESVLNKTRIGKKKKEQSALMR